MVCSQSLDFFDNVVISWLAGLDSPCDRSFMSCDG